MLKIVGAVYCFPYFLISVPTLCKIIMLSALIYKDLKLLASTLINYTIVLFVKNIPLDVHNLT